MNNQAREMWHEVEIVHNASENESVLICVFT